MRNLIFMIWLCLSLNAEVIDFSLIKMSSQSKTSPHILLIGGIQGDEPGGFNALNLFLQHYTIKQGEVWVIPNLNAHSILQNHRGIYGDMNRKFKTLQVNDPEYPIIERLKKIILDDEIEFIFHLHDGSGFYREKFISNTLNPNRWGNCSIIDQAKLNGAKYGDLLHYSQNIVKHINQNALKDLHLYRVRNTHTAKEDKEMEKSLTFFAVQNNKGAIANEASKNLSVAERVYYHLLAIEGMLETIGVKFDRNFALTPKNVQKLIDDKNARIQIANLITLPMMGLKKKISYFPLPSKDIASIAIKSNHYIVGMLKKNNVILLKYGNRVVTQFSPLYLEFSKEKITLDFEVDGERKEVRVGEILKVKNNFKVVLPKDSHLRVNIIGFSPSNNPSTEANLNVKLTSMIKAYSIDIAQKQYRVEIYRGKVFMGMVIVEFDS
ncbi:M99 family carboxypeptidase catalytic domain-containing protein [Helicobacter cholecystus]|uniref:M99 family carboxypeptidase catalytic domain-containing protein n=1 Tax=Helicobacter cholecystus TaxID=45498 RepID=UPI0027399A27|nr:M99 family carboxypeptidase catalytic domain-containing protein [Helicobacter cholecystus]